MQTRPCRRCANPMIVGKASLPEPMCHPCRRLDPQRKDYARPAPVVLELRICACGATFTPTRKQAVDCAACRGERPSATERGYGTTHIYARRAALMIMREGDECARCGDPMYRTQPLDLDHADDRASYLGLSHAWCNRSAGGTLIERTPRVCRWCSRVFAAKAREQRLCSTACRIAERASNVKPKPKPALYKRSCSFCGSTFTTKFVTAKRCSRPCADEENRRTMRDKYWTKRGLTPPCKEVA